MYTGVFRALIKADLNISSKIYCNAFISHMRNYCQLKFDNNNRELNVSKAFKYEKFQDADSPTIFDIEEERKRSQIMEKEMIEKDISESTLQRGLTGVFDIEELVEVIRQNKGQDVCVISVPKNLKYVDFMCSVTCRNAKHMLGIAEFVRKVYKMKRLPTDQIPKIEGANSREWIAMDLGNIALHLFLKKVREKYDIDMLWSIGPEFDTETNKPEEAITELLENHSVYLEKLIPKT